MTPDEVRMLDNKYAILFIRGERPILDLKYDIFKHPKFSLTEDGGAKPYIHNEVNRDVANIEILNISLKDIEKLDVPDWGYELLTETELEKELDKEKKSNDKIE